MKEKNLKYLLHLLVCIAASFACIYLFVFAGGWKLIESGDILLIEIAVSIVVGIIFFVIYEFSRLIRSDYINLKNQIDELQKQIDDLSKSKNN